MLKPVALLEAARALTEHWSPKVVGTSNDSYVKVAKVCGEFVWHKHEHEDELFLVLSGRLVIELDGYLGVEKTLVLKPGEVRKLNVALKRTPVARAPKKERPSRGGTQPAAAGFGFLNVTSDPWASITIDGKAYGQTPQAGIKLAAGSHTVVLTPGSGSPKRFTVVISADQTTRKRFKLE